VKQAQNIALSKEDVLHVARLSALEVREEDIPQLQRDLGEILAFVHRLSEVSTEAVAPTSHVHGSFNVFRDDIIKDSLPLESVAKNAPDFTASSFRVPKII
jgi:aspartyl-tRNA(Asn)/glutamyl-tRNA(Gln) amidotransferase subunit C